MISASQQIDDIINMHPNWQGEMLSRLRAVVNEVDPTILEEVKWKKPSRLEGVPVWSRGGMLCVADVLKKAVRLTFPKGAQIKDEKLLFNARLDSSAVRAIDFAEGQTVNETALRVLILEAIAINEAKAK